MKKIIISIEDIERRCWEISQRIDRDGGLCFYGIPRGGITPAAIIAAMCKGNVVNNYEDADYIVDDLVDSGKTRDRYKLLAPKAKFIPLYEKLDHEHWLVFPWEICEDGNDISAEDIFTRFLEYVGENTSREGLVETPARMAKAWKFWTSGYNQNPDEVFKVFSDGGEDYDQMIMLDPIPFYSHCEHHMAAMFGEVYIAYIPNKKIAGLSKFARLVDIFSRRLQVQERLTTQIAETIERNLNPLGVAVFIKGTHFCIESRGVQKPGMKAKTSAMRGAFKNNPETRAEFFSLIKV